MSMAPRVRKFLESRSVPYQLIRHRYAETAKDCAQQSKLPAHKFAKAVVLKDQQGFVVAVLPANRCVDLPAVNSRLNRILSLADQTDLRQLFSDCVVGAVPALAQAYDLSVVWDERIVDEPACCIEAGDHQELVCMSRNSFINLMKDGCSGRISSGL